MMNQKKQLTSNENSYTQNTQKIHREDWKPILKQPALKENKHTTGPRRIEQSHKTKQTEERNNNNTGMS